VTRTTRLLLLAVTVAAATGCTPSGDAADPDPTQAAPTDQVTTQETTPAPQGTPQAPVAGPHGGEPIADGLVTPPGTVLVEPAQTVSQGDVTGWWAALEVTGDDLDAVADDLGAQLARAGLQVQIGTVDDVVVVRAEGVTGQVVRHYDVQVIPAGQGLPAQVQILAAAEPAVAP
jgi:hypothetical protein